MSTNRYIVIIQTTKPKTLESEIRRMVKACFAKDARVEVMRTTQVLADKRSLPLYEALVSTNEQPFGKLPKYVKRLALLPSRKEVD